MNDEQRLLELKERLSSQAFQVTQQAATETPFTGEYHEFSEVGSYQCICCDFPLFNSAEKFYSSCGWPAFSQVLDKSTIEKVDQTHNMNRIEILCRQCNAHLGHKFSDGPTGTRYCINSVSLSFKPTH